MFVYMIMYVYIIYIFMCFCIYMCIYNIGFYFLEYLLVVYYFIFLFGYFLDLLISEGEM